MSGRSQQITGTVVRADFGPGAWMLEQADGTRWALQVKGRGDPALLRQGNQVTVQGRVAHDAVGADMTGATVLAVESWQPAD